MTRKLHRRYDDGLSRSDFTATPKMHFMQAVLLGSYWFDSQLCGGELQSARLSNLSQAGDYTAQSLHTGRVGRTPWGCLHILQGWLWECSPYGQLQTFAVHFQEVMVKESATTVNFSIFLVKNYFFSLSHGQSSLLSRIRWLLQLILIMPATNATSERSFSSLRRLKN